MSLALSCSAQESEAQSPTMGKDGSIIFRFAHPKDKEVELEGSFPNEPKMTWNDGAWTCRFDSLPSEMYTYRFSIDEKTKLLDPENKRIVRDITDTLNYFIVKGFPGSYYMNQDVSHGTVKQVWYPSSFDPDMKQRRLSIYLPPTYDQGESSFPVLYLLHGTGGDEMAWLEMGRLAQIMDNMIAQGKAKPMIVVMPNGIAELDAAPGQSPYMKGKASHSNVSSWMGRTEKAFPQEVVPFIEKNFRTIADKKHRAIAGLSMGGLHTIAISANNPTLFDYVGLFSPQSSNALTERNIRRIMRVTDHIGKLTEKLADKLPNSWVEKKYEEGKEAVSDVDVYQNLDEKLKAQFATPPALYYIAIGRKDPLRLFLNRFRQRLTNQGCAYLYQESDGAHTWENWRKYLLDFLPRIF